MTSMERQDDMNTMELCEGIKEEIYIKEEEIDCYSIITKSPSSGNTADSVSSTSSNNTTDGNQCTTNITKLNAPSSSTSNDRTVVLRETCEDLQPTPTTMEEWSPTPTTMEEWSPVHRRKRLKTGRDMESVTECLLDSLDESVEDEDIAHAAAILVKNCVKKYNHRQQLMVMGKITRLLENFK